MTDSYELEKCVSSNQIKVTYRKSRQARRTLKEDTFAFVIYKLLLKIFGPVLGPVKCRPVQNKCHVGLIELMILSNQI